ncbi:DUF502 domain-containing protein [Chitinophagaceae bacterium LB-8]|uniref:DUF502 domain-containing protein n=1 Tax=Paraflavisolibacter caeni TaxID=2982496 RepID=A0A9X2Y0H8_9BACT|nr:DUF502 domain-containing protein [Paraflavisolibacter caeni]MCU7552316.1 DUF502 domain-containing protein [Paraflavisolibacter caeni]
MKSHKLSFFKSTLLSGIITLVPLLVFFIVVAKAYDWIKRLTKPIIRLFPTDSYLSLPVQELVAVLVMFLICIIVGLIANSRKGKRKWLVTKLENAILVHIPGYTIMKSMGENMSGMMNQDKQQVVIARFDDSFQLGFLMEKVEGKENISAIYIPGTPNPWSGSLCFLSNDRIQRLNISYSEALTCIKNGGLGASALLQKSGKVDIQPNMVK